VLTAAIWLTILPDLVNPPVNGGPGDPAARDGRLPGADFPRPRLDAPRTLHNCSDYNLV